MCKTRFDSWQILNGFYKKHFEKDVNATAISIFFHFSIFEPLPKWQVTYWPACGWTLKTFEMYCIVLHCIVMFWLSFHFLAHALPRPLWSPLCTLKVYQYVWSDLFLHHYRHFPLFVHPRFNNLSDAITFHFSKLFLYQLHFSEKLLYLI